MQNIRGVMASGWQAQHRVMRGTWFVEKGLDWVPLSETVADELETAFRREVHSLSKQFANLMTDACKFRLLDLGTARRESL